MANRTILRILSRNPGRSKPQSASFEEPLT